MFNMQQAEYAANILNVKFDKFTKEEFLDGINIELEHGRVDQRTNVTNDNLIITAKIALAHLNEYQNYYNKEYGLRQFEKYLDFRLKQDNYEKRMWLTFFFQKLFTKKELFFTKTPHLSSILYMKYI